MYYFLIVSIKKLNILIAIIIAWYYVIESDLNVLVTFLFSVIIFGKLNKIRTFKYCNNNYEIKNKYLANILQDIFIITFFSIHLFITNHTRVNSYCTFFPLHPFQKAAQAQNVHLVLRVLNCFRAKYILTSKTYRNVFNTSHMF